MDSRPTAAPVNDWQDVTPPAPAQASPAQAKPADDWQNVNDWQDVGDAGPTAGPKPDPGFLHGLWDSTVGGVGSAIKRYGIDKAAQDYTDLKQASQEGHYGDAAKAVISSAFPGIPVVKDVVNGMIGQGSQAIDAAKRGDYPRAALHAVGVVPLVGPAIAETGENIADPNTRAYGIGQGVGAALTLAAPKVIPKVAEVAGKLPTAIAERASGINRLAPEQMVVKGLRGSFPSGRTNFYQNLSTSMPAIKAAESLLGKPIESLDDLIGTPQKPGAIQLAKRANRAEYNQLLGPQQAMNAQINLSPVADAMEGSISPKTALENPGEAARIQAIANKYRGPFSVDTVDSLLRNTNAELNSYYGKNPAARSVAAAANPDTAMLDAQAQALRDAFYKHLDAPQQGAAARQLQREYGSLSELEDAMQKRKNIALRQAPDSLSEQLAKWSSLGDVLHGGTQLLAGNPFGVGKVLTGLAKVRLAKWLKEQQGTDALIKRAFANHDTPRMPVNFPPPVQPAGLLGPGPIVTPPPIDTSGPVPNAGPRMGMGMSPNAPSRQGLLGPATGGPSIGPSGNPIITPAPEGSYPVSGPMAPQYPVGSGNNRLLGHPQSIPGNPGPFGMSMGDDLVPVTHPQTGHVEYVPKWMTQGAGGEAAGAALKPKVADGTVVRSKSNPSVRMVYKAGEWHPHP